MISPEMQIIEYIDQMPDSTSYLSRDIVLNATPAFRDQDRLVQDLIPATSGEEITPLLHQLRMQQRRMSRFGAIISCNDPSTSDGRELDKVEGDIVSFQRAHPDMPLSYFRTEYKPGTPVGEIRRDLGNAAIQTEIILAPTIKDIVLANCDADTSKLSSNTMYALEKLFMSHQGEHIIADPYLRHANSGGSLPNMDRVVGWADAYAYYSNYSAWESHGAMWASSYAAAGGHSPFAFIGETHYLVHDLERTHSVEYHRINGVATVSPRKFYKNMSEGKTPQYSEVRSARETYRGQRFTTDIAPDAADEFINGAKEEAANGSASRARYDPGLIKSTVECMFDQARARKSPIPKIAVDGIRRRLYALQKMYGGSIGRIDECCRMYHGKS